jgi:hypothetical protein
MAVEKMVYRANLLKWYVMNDILPYVTLLKTIRLNVTRQMLSC